MNLRSPSTSFVVYQRPLAFLLWYGSGPMLLRCTKRVQKSFLRTIDPCRFCLLKILEKAVCERLFHACLPALPDFQHGFIPRRSGVSNLACFIDHCQGSLSAGLQTDAIYIDFSFAFTSDNHRLLLYNTNSVTRLTSLDLRLVALSHTLSQRSQRVILDGKHSDWLPVLSGVPEGSVLGPILFSCYVADLPRCISNGCLAYTDDVKIFHRIKTHSDTLSLQAELDRFCEWSKFWHLKLIPAKYSREPLRTHIPTQGLSHADENGGTGTRWQRSQDFLQRVTHTKNRKLSGFDPLFSWKWGDYPPHSQKWGDASPRPPCGGAPAHTQTHTTYMYTYIYT